jgi:ParB family chromosome partitioning protein
MARLHAAGKAPTPPEEGAAIVRATDSPDHVHQAESRSEATVTGVETPGLTTLAETPPSLGAQNIAIERIKVRKERRAVDPAKVAELARSISENGLYNPITISSDEHLLAGLHRLEAVRRLGYTHVPVSRLPVNGGELRAEVIAIEENVVRNDLTELERGDGLLRLKIIYEKLHPQTKIGATPGKQGGGKNSNAKTDKMSSFADHAAARLNVDPRTVRRLTKIGTIEEGARAVVRGTPVADHQANLAKIAAAPRAEQEAAARAMVAKTTKKAAAGGQRRDAAAGKSPKWSTSSSDDRQFIQALMAKLQIAKARFLKLGGPSNRGKPGASAGQLRLTDTVVSSVDDLLTALTALACLVGGPITQPPARLSMVVAENGNPKTGARLRRRPSHGDRPAKTRSLHHRAPSQSGERVELRAKTGTSNHHRHA